MRKSQSAVVLGIDKFLIENALPTGVFNTSVAKPTATGPGVPHIRLDSPGRATLLFHLFGYWQALSLAGTRGMFCRYRSAKNRQGGRPVADHFVLFHSANPKIIP